MRDAKASDYWRHVYEYSEKSLYKNYISKLIVNDCNGFTGEVEMSPGITILCGLNGVGKSSLIANIKSSLGLSDSSIVSKNKFTDRIDAKIVIEGEEFDEIPLGKDAAPVCYIDSDQALECLKYWEQSNIEELLEAEEPFEFSKAQVEELSELVGKEYLSWSSYEISDQEKTFVPVFFKISESEKQIEYDSTGMGIGEHFIIYMYYILEKLDNNTILIIEEPESYISVLSQRHFMNYLAKIISEKKISVVITSHSPHIINMVRKDNIRLLIKLNGELVIYTPGEQNEAENVLGIEYKKIENIIECKNTIATIFVEDYAARIFLEILLDIELPYIKNNVDIVSVGGDSFVTERLTFDDSEYMSHKLIGIYDADLQNTEVENTIRKKVKWPVLFLPINECVEKDIFNYLKVNDHIDLLCDALNIKDKNYFKAMLSKTMHDNHHDKFPNLCKYLEKEKEDFIKAYYLCWKNEQGGIIKSFCESLFAVLFSDQDSIDVNSVIKNKKECAISK